MEIKFIDFFNEIITLVFELEKNFTTYNNSKKSLYEKPIILKFLNTNNLFLIFEKKYPKNSIVTLNKIQKKQLDLVYDSLKIINSAILLYKNDKFKFEKVYSIIEREIVILIKLSKIIEKDSKEDSIFKFIKFINTNILYWKKENKSIDYLNLDLNSDYLKFIKIIIYSYDQAYSNISICYSIEAKNLFINFEKSIKILKLQYSNFEKGSIDKKLFLDITLNEINIIFSLNSNSPKKNYFTSFFKKREKLELIEYKLRVWSYQKLISQLIIDFKIINENNISVKIPEILDFYKSKDGFFLDQKFFKLGGLNIYEEKIWNRNILNLLENFEKDYNLFLKNHNSIDFLNKIKSINQVFINLNLKINDELPNSSKLLEDTKNKSYIEILNSIKTPTQLIIQIQIYLKNISQITGDAYKLKYILKEKEEKINYLNQNSNSVLTKLFKLKTDDERLDYYIKNINPNISMLGLIFDEKLKKILVFNSEKDRERFYLIKKQIEFIKSNLTLTKDKKRSIPNFLADIEIAKLNISKIIRESKVDLIKETQILSSEKIIEKSVSEKKSKKSLFNRISLFNLTAQKQKSSERNYPEKSKKLGLFGRIKNKLFGNVPFQMYVTNNLKNKFDSLFKIDFISNLRELLKLKEIFKSLNFNYNNDFEKDAYRRILIIFTFLDDKLKDYDNKKIDINELSQFVKNGQIIFNRIESSSIDPNMDSNPNFSSVRV